MKMSRTLLDQSRRAFEARQNIQPLPNDRKSNASQSVELNRKNSHLHTFLRKLERNVQNKKENREQKIFNSTPPPPPIQTKTAPHIRTAHSWQTTSENSEKYWDDDLDSLKPPLNDGRNSYGVSENGADDFTDDCTDKVSNHSQDSHKELNRLMLKAFLSEKEPEEPKAMKDIIDEVYVGDILPVFVTDINGPMKFWVAILLPKFTKQRETLYQQMQ